MQPRNTFVTNLIFTGHFVYKKMFQNKKTFFQKRFKGFLQNKNQENNDNLNEKFTG